MYSPIDYAVIKTVCYADVFDYPLTFREITKRLIEHRDSPDEIQRALAGEKNISFKNGFYFLKGRGEIVSVRKKRKVWSGKKRKIAGRVALLLRFIPSVKLVGISGGLAIDNCERSDDIDLFIICRRNLLWTTRLLVTLIIHLTGMRRVPKEGKAKNKICLNMFITEDSLTLPKGERDLFAAHEVIQMSQIYSKQNLYGKFLSSNGWVMKFLPNALNNLPFQSPQGENENILDFIWVGLDFILKHIQLRYMKNKRSGEIIANGIIRFHPEDARIWVMRGYRERIKKYGL